MNECYLHCLRGKDLGRSQRRNTIPNNLRMKCHEFNGGKMSTNSGKFVKQGNCSPSLGAQGKVGPRFLLFFFQRVLFNFSLCLLMLLNGYSQYICLLDSLIVSTQNQAKLKYIKKLERFHYGELVSTLVLSLTFSCYNYIFLRCLMAMQL